MQPGTQNLFTTRMDSHMTKLLTIDANPKTVKGNAQGYMTAVLHLAPANASGYDVCPMAEMAGCTAGCLNTAGRGGIAKDSATFETPAGDLPDNVIQRARIRRTRFYFEDREGFMAQLVREVAAFVRRAGRKGLTPTLRLNGTSDLLWERVPCQRDGEAFPSIFHAFPDLQCYDYTKHPGRPLKTMPANYHLSLSYSGADPRFAAMTLHAHSKGAPLVVVVRDDRTKARVMGFAPHAIDGDETDLRFLDAPGSLVVLKAKGKAKKDSTGFVLDLGEAMDLADSACIARARALEAMCRAGSLIPALAA
jgi:hypothetical protein